MRDWLARYRWATFLAGGFCVAAAAVIGWSLIGRSGPAEPDPFAEIDIELGEPAVAMRTTEVPLLTVPPQGEPSEFRFDHVASSVSDTDPLRAAAVTAHFSSDPAPTLEAAKPVWFLGTIEPLEETTAPSVVPIEVRQAVGAERFRR